MTGCGEVDGLASDRRQSPLALGLVRQRPAGRSLGALVSRLVSAAAAGGFDNGQCLPALSDLMASGFARLPCASSGACGFNRPDTGNPGRGHSGPLFNYPHAGMSEPHPQSWQRSRLLCSFVNLGMVRSLAEDRQRGSVCVFQPFSSGGADNEMRLERLDVVRHG